MDTDDILRSLQRATQNNMENAAALKEQQTNGVEKDGFFTNDESEPETPKNSGNMFKFS